MIGALVFVGALVASGQAPNSVSLPLGEGEKALSAALGDWDGDGRLGLAVAIASQKGRELAALAPDGAPRWRMPLPADVVAYAIGPVGAEAGAKVVLVTATGAFLARPGAQGAERYQRLAQTDVLWQLADASALPHVPDLLVDLDGDGKLDLLLPRADGYGAFRQELSADGFGFVPRGVARLPDPEALAAERGLARPAVGESDNRAGWRVRFGSRASNGGVLLTVSQAVPAPYLGRFGPAAERTLFALDDLFLHTFAVGADGSLSETPTQSLVSPVEVDLRRSLDVSWRALLADVDGDGRSDALFVAADQRSKDVRTQILVFSTAAQTAGDPPLLGAQSRPSQVLVLAGFVGNVDLVDVDGDGRRDLVATSVRPDLLEALRQATAERVEAELYVYRNEGGRFARRPEVTRRLSFSVQDADPLVQFVAAPRGRGQALLLRQDPGVLELWEPAVARGGALEFPRAPRWRLPVSPEGRVVLLRIDRGVESAAVLESNLVRWVRWR